MIRQPEIVPPGRPRWRELELQMAVASQVLVPYLVSLYVLSALLVPRVPLGAWLGWFGLCATFIAGRETLTRTYFSRPPPERVARVNFWRACMLVSATCFGLVWGCAVLLGFLYGSPTLRLFWTFLALAVATMSSCSLPRRLLHPQLAAMLAPLATAWAVYGGEQAGPVLCGMAIAVVALLLIARWRALRERDHRTLALCNQRLARSLARRNRQLVAAGHNASALLVRGSVGLRRPVQTLSLLMPLLAAPDRGAAVRRLDLARRNVEALADMLHQLRDFSRLESGLYVARPQAVDLPRLLGEAQRGFAALAQRKGLALTVACEPVVASSDARLLRRIVFNLVANAIAYTPKGEVRVEGGRDGAGVYIAVADTGPGLPANGLECDGLGLSIVRKGAALLGHPLSVSSIAGRGTSIRLALGDAASPREEPVEPAAVLDDSLAGLRVAIIENDPHVLQSLTHSFAAWRCTVFAGADAARVEQQLRGIVPGLVLSDLHLGSAPDGFAAIRQLRERAGRAALPAIMLTGDLDPQLEARASADAIWLAHKPMRASQLRQLVVRATRATPRPPPRAGSASVDPACAG